MWCNFLGFASCDNTLSIPSSNNKGQVKLVHSPDAISWSGDEIFINTFGTRSMNLPAMYNANPNQNEWQNKPNDITEDEVIKVSKWFNEHQYPESLDLNWTDFYVQFVYGQHGNMDQLVVNTNDHVNNFNANLGSIMLMENTLSKDFGYHSSQDSQFHYNYVIVCIDGAYYVGFDYEANGQNLNQQETPDGYYSDWIIKITPANGIATPPTTEQPSQSGDDETELFKHDNEVEVNYAILDEHDNLEIADLVTKLSIHVRCATNVDIKIPVPYKYLVESDDLYIFTDHDYFVYNDTEHTLSTTVIGGNEVTLNVQLSENEIHVWTTGINETVIDYCMDYNNDGINFELYNYFETSKQVWNDGDKYLEEHSTPTKVDNINRTELLECMNNATISFTNNPEYYINAFGCSSNEHWGQTEDIEHVCIKHHEHATVKPLDETIYTSFVNDTYHLNGTPFNDIYYRNDVVANKAHK